MKIEEQEINVALFLRGEGDKRLVAYTWVETQSEYFIFDFVLSFFFLRRGIFKSFI